MSNIEFEYQVETLTKHNMKTDENLLMFDSFYRLYTFFSMMRAQNAFDKYLSDIGQSAIAVVDDEYMVTFMLFNEPKEYKTVILFNGNSEQCLRVLKECEEIERTLDGFGLKNKDKI